MHGQRTVGALVVSAVLLTGCAAVGDGTDLGSGLGAVVAEAPSTTPDESALTTLDDERDRVLATLDGVAAAFLAADPEALRPWLHDPDSTFGRRWLDRAAALAGVPLSSYELTLDVSLPDLTAPDVPGDGGLLVNVLEDHQLAGMEELGPARDHLFLTLRERDGRLTVAGDTDGEPLGLVSADHLWDHGPVVTTRRDRVLALHHPDQPSVDTVLDEAEAALATTDARWPLAWPGVVPVLIPRDQEELGELLHVTYDLSNFIAFATTSPVGTLGDTELAGSRIMLNTGRFLERSSATRERILVHELVHAASRPSSSTAVPSWLEEGVAQALGEERSTTGRALLDGRGGANELPLDAQFSVGGRDRIFLSYQQSWSFVQHLVDRFGTDEVGRFYHEAGRRSQLRPGTDRALVDAAARAVFGSSLGTLVDEWRATL